MEPTTGAGTSEYIYPPLSSKTSIRLLRLLPGRGDVIECEILECNIDNPTSFQALSYSWGSDENSKTIVCAGKQYLRVRSNLYHALWFIRDPTISKTLWVDAVCIDQGNVLERNHQVSQMTAIYTKAEKLIIWLGNENNDVAVKFIARLAMTAQNQNANHGMLIKPRIHRSEWQALRRFVNASWFRRMWVVQELVLGLQMEGPMATEILLGQHSVLWVELVRCCKWTRENYASLATDAATALVSDAIYSSIERVLHLHHMALQREKGQQTEREWSEWLLATLPAIRDKQATDPRDKLFALYGLCTSVPRPLPDYTLTTALVFQGYARYLTMISKSLDVLHEREMRQTALGKALPSWAPDWSTTIERTSFRTRGDLRPDIKVNAAVHPPDFSFGEQSSNLGLPITGLIIDEIVRIGDVITMEAISELKRGRDSWMYKLWRSWRDVELTPTQPSPAIASQSDGPSYGVQLFESHFGYQWSNTKVLGRTGQRRRMGGMGSPYRNRESEFSCFIRTMITNVPLAGLDTLISDGDERFWELLSNTARSMDSPASMLKASSRQWKVKQDKWSERFGRYRAFLQTQGDSPASSALALLATGMHVAPPQPAIEDSTIETYLSLMAKWTRGRRFFTTKKGHIGLGVQDSAVGDRVVILSMHRQPSRTPFLLRVEPRSAIVRLVGEAYIHNFKNPEGDKLPWITMNIS